MTTNTERYDAWIFTGGDWHEDKCKALLQTLSAPSRIYAADAGYKKALAAGVRPDSVVGDFDSMARPSDLPDGVELLVVPAEKDDTDTMLACSCAIEKGCRSLLILGGTGGRADHGLSNILYLEALRNNGIHALLTDGENRITVLRDETVVLTDRGGYFSVMSLTDCAHVTLTGCKYPLRDATLRRELPYAVSNEVLPGREAVVQIHDGTVVVMETVR